jgi:hypothetical protein
VPSYEEGRQSSLPFFAATFGPYPYRLRFTVTVKVAVLSLPLVSIAEHRTLVRPTLNQLRDLGRHIAGSLPSMSSCAVTE